MAKIIKTSSRRLSPWTMLDTKTVHWDDMRGDEVYHSFSQADYVSVLAVTKDKKIPLVRQYRPGCEDYTLEFPGGMLERGETPADCAKRELFEEAGLESGELEVLGSLWPDPGRLSNQLHCFFVGNAVVSSREWQVEQGLEIKFFTLNDVLAMIAAGQFKNAHHVAIVGLAMMAGLLGS